MGTVGQHHYCTRSTRREVANASRAVAAGRPRALTRARPPTPGARLEEEVEEGRGCYVRPCNSCVRRSGRLVGIDDSCEPCGAVKAKKVDPAQRPPQHTLNASSSILRVCVALRNCVTGIRCFQWMPEWE